jgi:hypothetical protein
MSESSTVSIPQVGTVVADGIVYVTTAYPLPPPPDTSHLITEDDTPDVGLGVTLWEGTFEGMYSTWLR